MTRLPLQQRCFNHDNREAVCLCPECGRSYCRECTSEHGSRLLCASCLRAMLRARPAESAARRAFSLAGLTLAGVLIAWTVFFGLGEAILTLNARVEQTIWQNR